MAKILLVEDYKSLQTIYLDVLTKHGHEVVLVDDGFKALEETAKTTFDGILLDLLLPHASGMDFLRQYKPLAHPETKVVIYSNFSNPKFRQEATELGVKHYLTKAHLTPTEVVAILEQALQE